MKGMRNGVPGLYFPQDPGSENTAAETEERKQKADELLLILIGLVNAPLSL